MGITTAVQLQNYYDIFRDQEVTYTKEILRTLSIDPRQIYVKCNGAQWPCIINSTSFMFAKIIVGVKGGAYAAMSRKNPPTVSLRFYFTQAHAQPISFFVTGKVTEITPYMNSNELSVITITFTQRPPDALIERVGALLEANTNSIRRKDERIVITEDSKRRLGMTQDQTIIYIDNVPRRCILRDISFSGAKVILVGIEKYVIGKQTLLRFAFDDPQEIVTLTGSVVKTFPVENKPEIIYACLQFKEDLIPTSYKIRINNYLTTIRKTILNAATSVQQNAQSEKQKVAVASENANAENAESTNTTIDATENTNDANITTETTKNSDTSIDSTENVATMNATTDATMTTANSTNTQETASDASSNTANDSAIVGADIASTDATSSTSDIANATSTSDEAIASNTDATSEFDFPQMDLPDSIDNMNLTT